MEESKFPILIEQRDSLFESIENDIDGNRERFDQIISELEDTQYLECCISNSDDSVMMYKAKTGLHWATIVDLADPIKKKILLQLIQNPKCFFVLFNTQKGKLRIIGKEISSWVTTYKKRVVSYLVVDNDRTLSEQSVNGLFSCFPVREDMEESTDPQEKYKVRIFELSSNNKVQLNDVITYIDAYAYNPNYPMPVVIVLANNTQIKKLLTILDHVQKHTCVDLCAGGAWDEADKTYPQYRDKPFKINGTDLTFLKLLNDPRERLIRNGFVTATEGDLLEEEYDECANAFHYPVVISAEDNQNYFAFHHDESIKHAVTVRTRESNNTIAERVLTENWLTHFSVPFLLDDLSEYHHKVIINSDMRASEMEKFAQGNREKADVITFNMQGLKLYLESGSVKYYPVRKQNLNKLLFYIYKKNNLGSRPLLIIGRRKVDRGLGFHYAPRSYGQKVTAIDGKDGILQTDGKEGLIWTDMIMGNKIEHIPTAVQKAGRGAGIIRQCPQFPREFHYWIDNETSSHINRHYQKVDKVNELRGTNSILQAVTHAEALIPIVRRNHDIDPNTFRVIKGSNSDETLQITKDIIKDIFGESFRKPQITEGFYKTSLNNTSTVVSLFDAVKKVPGAYGTNIANGERTRTYRRFLPSYKNIDDPNTLHCVIPLIDPSYTQEQKDRLNAEFAGYIVTIPQEGDY